jgi:hypothetical protein
MPLPSRMAKKARCAATPGFFNVEDDVPYYEIML